MDNDNILDKLRKNRQRATVERQDPLFNQDNPQKQEETTIQPKKNEIKGTLAELKEKLAQIPSTKRRSGIVLESALDLELTSYCKQQGITVETFLEATWLTVQGTEMLAKITAEAKIRYNQRKSAGQLRRLITTLENQESD